MNNKRTLCFLLLVGFLVKTTNLCDTENQSCCKKNFLKTTYTSPNDSGAVVIGSVLRLYPQNGILYFHVSGDTNNTAYGGYNYVLCSNPSFEQTFLLLLNAKIKGWNVTVRRAGQDAKGNYEVAYITVE